MSEPIPESIPTSQDPRSKRPLKRRALTPLSEQATEIQSLFKDPSKEIRVPELTKARTAATLAPPPEIVANVQGSSAGAGSGEFHVYKASRRREYERQRLMDDELKREKADEEFRRKIEEAKKKDEEKTERNRRRREKRKAGKGKKGTEKNSAGSSGDADMTTDGADTHAAAKSKGSRQEASMDGEVGTNGQTHEEEKGIIIHDDD
jgi:hypothetical protein